MSKFIILDFESGSFEEGFKIRLRLECHKNMVSSDNPPSDRTKNLILDKNPELLELYREWRGCFQQLCSQGLRKDPNLNLPPCISHREFQRKGDQLSKKFSRWLSEVKSEIPDQWRKNQNSLVVVKTEDNELRRFPWTFWDLSGSKSKLEVVLARREHQGLATKSPGKVRILALFGNNSNMNSNSDRRSIEKLVKENLPDAELKALDQFSLKDLIKEIESEEGWDILFFSGHSKSYGYEERGEIEINNSGEAISFGDLQESLEKAVQNGLTLAIFNSCQGLGISLDLAKINLPQVIVMREVVLDTIASAFLRYFLKYFKQGNSLLNSLKKTRKDIKQLEKNGRSYSWLPVLCVNPDMPLLTWEDLKQRTEGINREVATEETPVINKNLVINKKINAEKNLVGVSENHQILKNSEEEEAVTSELLDKEGREAPLECVTEGEENEGDTRTKPWRNSLVIFYTILVILGGTTAVGTNFLYDQYQKIRIEKIKKSGTDAKEGVKDSQIEPLVSAIEVGIRLKEYGDSVRDYPTVVPLFALQHIGEQIKEKNHISVEYVSEFTNVAFTPGSSFWNLAIADLEGNAWIWDNSNQELIELVDHELTKLSNGYDQAHEKRIISLSYDPTGNLLVTAGEDSVAKVWDLSQNIPILRNKLNKVEDGVDIDSGSINSVDFSRNRQLIATASGDGKIRLWNNDNNNGKPEKEWQAHEGKVNAVAFSPRQDLIASAGDDGIVYFWDYSGNRLNDLRGFPTDKESMNSLSFSPDGNYIVTVSSDGKFQVWTLEGERQDQPNDCEDGVSSVSDEVEVRAASFQDESHIAIGRGDGSVIIIDLFSTKCFQLKGHQKGIQSLSFRADSEFLATASKDGTVRLWDLSDKPNKLDSIVGVAELFLSPNLTEIAVVKENKKVNLIDLEKAEKREEQISLSGQCPGQFADLDYHREREQIIIATDRKDICLLDYFGERENIQWQDEGKWENGGIALVKLIPNRDLVATISNDGRLSFFEPSSGDERNLIDGGMKKFQNIFSSYDGKLFVTLEQNNTARFWNRYGNSLDLTVNENLKGVSSIAFSDPNPNFQLLALGDRNGEVRLWEIRKGEIKRMYQESYSGGGGRMRREVKSPEAIGLDAHRGKVTGIRFSSDGQYLVTGGEDGKVCLWRRERLTDEDTYCQSHGSSIKLLEFSPNSDFVASLGEDGKLILWSLEGFWSGEEDEKIAEYKDIKDFVISQGQDNALNLVILTKSGELEMKESVADLDYLLEQACTWLEDYFTSNPDSKNLCSPH